MHTLRSIRSVLALIAVFMMATGCDVLDSGTDPNAAEDTETTVSFATGQISLTEESSPIEIVVTLNNPRGREVSGELLLALGVSETGPEDFNLPEENRIGENAFLAGEFSFPASAEDGATQTLTFDITDDVENEDQEDGVFVFQNLQNASLGQNSSITIAVGAIQLLNETFDDETLGTLTAVSVASNENWETSSNGNPPNAPYAVCNGFRGNELSNDWLITRAFNFNEFEGETLTFLNAKGFDDSGRRGLDVFVSTDYDGESNPTDDSFTWVDISDQVAFSEGDFNFVSSGEIDLSGSQFQSDEVYIGFRYTQSGIENAAAWQLDNIVVTGQ